jgi:hypothetical protein
VPRSEKKALLRTRRASFSLIVLWLISWATAPGLAGEPNAEIFGAWAPPSEDCRKVFTLDGRPFSFRHPIDKSSLALIIGSKEVKFASATCSVSKMLQASDLTTFYLYCHNFVGFFLQKLEVVSHSDKNLLFIDVDDPDLRVKFKRCTRDP